MPDLKIKRLTDTAIIPTYGTDGAACFDLYADTVRQTEWGVLVGTGLSVEIPEGHAMMIYTRSGMGFKYGIVLRNGTGVIDADYRGEVKVALTCHVDDIGGSEFSYVLIDELEAIKQGDRIAQAMIIPAPQYSFVEVEELSETDRGTGGFGSTGK